MVRITGFVECRSQKKNCRRGPHGGCGNNYEIKKIPHFLTGASSRALTSRRQKGSAAGM